MKVRMRTYVMITFFIFSPTAVLADPYVFPVVPGTPEWSSMEYEERVAAMQVPEVTLAAMTTEDVHLTFLALPAAHLEWLFGESPQDGFDRFLVGRYNVVDTLLSRTDVACIVAAHYLTYLVDETILHDAEYNDIRSLTEMILCQYGIIAEMTCAEKLVVVEKAYDVIELNEETYPENALFSFTTYALVGRIMQVDEFPPFMDLIAADPYVAESLAGLWGNIAVYDMVPNYIEYMTAVLRVQDDTTPSVIMLDPPYPNPFNHDTTISISISETASVDLSVYAITGQKIETLVNGVLNTGVHHFNFNGSGLSSGLFIIKLEATQQIFTKKLTLLK